MKYLILTGLLVPAAALLLHTQPAHAACSDFATQPEAQAYFNRTGDGRMDRDGDGVVCEDLPPGSSATPTYTPQTDAARLRSRGTMDETDSVITGTGFMGYCTLTTESNLRSGPSTEAAIIGNSGDTPRRTKVHTSELHDGRLWAWATVSMGDRSTEAWVAAGVLEGCGG